MRRSIQGAIALLSVLVVAGCSAPSPEPTEAPPAASPAPTPSAPAEPVADWTLPADCAALAWTDITRAQEEYGDVVQETSAELIAALVGPEAEVVSCLSGPANSDAVITWAAARFDASTVDERIAAALAEGFETVSDQQLDDGVRSVRLAKPVPVDGLGEAFLDLIGDAALFFGNSNEYGAESLLRMADHLGLPTVSDWRLPSGCDEQIEGWTAFEDFVAANGWTSERMPGETDPDYSLMARLDYPGTDITCLWGLEASDWLHYLSISRLDAAERDAVLAGFAAEGYVTTEADDHLLLLRDVGPASIGGLRVDAAIVTEDALVHAEVLDGLDADQATASIEEFARSVGVIG